MKKSGRIGLLGAAILCMGILGGLLVRGGTQPPDSVIPEPTAVPGNLAGRIILVDPGHGGTDGGARAQDSGIWEKEINLQTAQALRLALENAGAQVIMTRETDSQFSEKKRADLTARLELAREGGADMLLSIHMNEYRSRKESGPQVFYRAGQEQSRLLAGALQDALIAMLAPSRKRAAMAGDYFMLSLDIPSVLIECGFLSNAAEEKLLLSTEYQQKIAQAICQGVEEYYRLQGK